MHPTTQTQCEQKPAHMQELLLLETICVLDGIPRRLAYHQARMDDAHRRLWGLSNVVDIHSLLQAPPEYRHGLVKCRIAYGPFIEKIEWERYSPATLRSLQLVDGSDLEYAFKYADRSGIARLMSLRGEADDILIVQNGLITDTSYCNVVCFDGHRYLTPAKPLLPGTCRARLLEQGIVEPSDIRPDELPRFKRIFLINAMLDLGDCVGNWNKRLTFASFFGKPSH